jgi:hypothetical protein
MLSSCLIDIASSKSEVNQVNRNVFEAVAFGMLGWKLLVETDQEVIKLEIIVSITGLVNDSEDLDDFLSEFVDADVGEFLA